MGRHVWFRTPTKDDRKDIFDLYLGKVAHDPSLDTPERRDEIARITNGYSPAQIDQICSMALMGAHHTGRAYFTWDDLVDAMTVIESGRPSTSQYHEDDARATAIHEAGHAATAHVYRHRGRVQPPLDQDARRRQPRPSLRPARRKSGSGSGSSASSAS